MRWYWALAISLLTVANGYLVWQACGPVGPTIIHNERSLLPISDPNYQTAKAVSYYSLEPDQSLDDLQSPIPMKDRVKNYTGIQCVYSSIEMLGRWAEEPKLMSPPITSRSNCKGYSGPSRAAEILRSLNVKFEQSHSNREKGLALIRKAMAEHRGCMFGIPGHAMVIVHFDEAKNVVKYVDNSDHSLVIQEMTVTRFLKKWDTWVLVIYADVDVIPMKTNPLARRIPIIDRNNQQGTYPPEYIPLPYK